MLTKRWPFILTGSLLITGIIIGSFFDLQINKALFSDRNLFGIIITSFSLALGYASLPFLGGILFRITLKQKFPRWAIAILHLISLASIGIATYFSGKEPFSVNSFNIPGIEYTLLATGISLVFQTGVFFISFKLSKNSEFNPRMFIVLIIFMLAVFVALVPGVTVVKSIMHRPRYRIVQLGEVKFYEWWKPCKNYKDFITDVVTKEEFKSFPSGHAGTSFFLTLLLTAIPVIFPKTRKYEILLFFIGFSYSMFVGFVRMLLGAHFLSDVCWGMMISFICLLISNIISRKILQNSKEKIQENYLKELKCIKFWLRIWTIRPCWTDI